MISKGLTILRTFSKGFFTFVNRISKGTNVIFRRIDSRATPPEGTTILLPASNVGNREIEYDYVATVLLTQEDVTIPDWTSILSVDTVQGSGFRRITTLRYTATNNVDSVGRTGQIIANLDETMAITHDLTQPRPPQVLGAEWVEAGAGTSRTRTTTNVRVPSNAGVDLLIFTDGTGPLAVTFNDAGQLRYREALSGNVSGANAVTDGSRTDAAGLVTLAAPTTVAETLYRIPFRVISNPDQSGIGVSIDISNAFSLQPDGTVFITNGVDRVNELTASITLQDTGGNVIPEGTSVNPGDNITVRLNANALLANTETVFEIFNGSVADANRIGSAITVASGDIQAPQDNRTFTFALPAGTGGASTSFDIVGQVTQTAITPATVTRPISTVNIRPTSVISSTTGPWNCSVLSLNLFFDAGLDFSNASAPLLPRFSQYSAGTVAGANLVIGQSPVVNRLEVAVFATAPNHSLMNNLERSYTLSFTYSDTVNTVFTMGMAQTSIEVSDPFTFVWSPRPRLANATGGMQIWTNNNGDSSLLPSDSMYSSFNFDATARIVMVADSGDEPVTFQNADGSTSGTVTRSIYPTVNTTSTDVNVRTDAWVDNADQSPTNAQLTADTTNQLREVFTSDELDAIAAEHSGIFDDGHTGTVLIPNFEDLRPYAAKYPITLMTLGSGTGRNTSTSTRTDRFCVDINTRT